MQLRKFGRFLEDHARQLVDIEDALGDSAGDSWDATLDPIELQVGYGTRGVARARGLGGETLPEFCGWVGRSIKASKS